MNARRLFFAMVALLCSAVVTAHDFAVNGIFYNITSSTTLTVEVTYGGSFGYIMEYSGSGSVVIPEKVTYNGREYSVTTIGVHAFLDCKGITSIKIPSSVTSIGNRALSGCYNLTSIVVDKGNSVYDSRDNCNAIIETSTNKLIQGSKNTTIPTSVTTIGERAFCNCSSLTNIEIPSSVTIIGDYAFWNCKDLTNIEIPSSVTIIGNDAFSSCSSLTSIEIPSSVTTIGVQAFEFCSGLTSIEIPSSVTSIGDRVFFGCKGLTNITSYIPADSLFALTKYTFSGMNKAACTLYVPYGAKTTYAATSGWKGFKKIVEREL